ncbi:MAG: hypothetical protein ACKVU2_10390 [Saprospiraceae bacterium]
MHTLNLSFPPPSWLTILESELVTPPEGVAKDLKVLKNNIRQALLGRYENLEQTFEGLLPVVWSLRVRVLPMLAQFDLVDTLKNAELHFSRLPQQIPALAGATEKLLFGMHLMKDFVEKLLAENPNFETELAEGLTHLPEKIPTWEEIEGMIFSENGFGTVAFKLIHGSLMMELILFAVDLAADEHLPLDTGICYELDYQSAVAIKTYAGAFGLDKSQMPWHTYPNNSLDKFLLEGPVVSESDMEYVHEKRMHLNSWI